MASHEEIVEKLAAWRSSGLSKAAFARAEGIPGNTFHYWCRRFGERSRAHKNAPAFVELPEVVSATSQGDHPRMRFALADGLVITVY